MRIAFVVQRYGLEVNGGAEHHCRTIAETLSKNFDVTVITTCALDYMTWDNYYPEGKSTLNGVTVWRFPVDSQRDVKKFNDFSEKILLNQHSDEDEIRWMKLQGPYSKKLLDFIETQKDNFDFFIFFTYLYCTTFFGLLLVKEKAILVPTAHDELPIYLKIFKKLFNSPAAIIYNTAEEKKFVNELFNNENIISEIAGVWVTLPEDTSDKDFRSKYKLKSRFALYIGRIDESKGCSELFEYFLRYKREIDSEIKLVLLGKPVMRISKNDDIIHLGFVSDIDKHNAILASEVIVVPSRYESLSLVLLEGWSCGVPCIVNAKSSVLKSQCIKSNGGLWYENYEEFKECLDLLSRNHALKVKLGENGRKYVDENYTEESIRDKYIKILNKLKPNS
ncbi:MAG: glycosyltransferase family 4 protein [Candidatus Micrarchaeota archaeon]|nr:glycosyltransferase family 4 protein [Candidatus Micrarchaeota archaeon]